MEEIDISSRNSSLNVTGMYNLLKGFFLICLSLRINGCNGFKRWVQSKVICNKGGWRWFRLKTFRDVSMMTKQISVFKNFLKSSIFVT